VTKKVATLTINSVAAKTYDGTAIKDPTDITTNVTTPTVTYTYYQDANGTKGTQLTSAPKDAGTYWVEGTIAETADTTAVTGAAVKFTIGKATPTVTLTATPNRATYGTQIALTVTTGGVNDEKPNGSADLKENGILKQTIIITNGTATYNSANDTVNTHLVTAEFTAT
ncbi:MAG: hypothetical protein RR415_14725, partial [Ruthenibacterium sp.]